MTLTTGEARLSEGLIFLFPFQVLKLYAWEKSFMSKVFNIRKKELKQLKNAAYLNATFAFTFTCAPFMVSYIHISFLINV